MWHEFRIYFHILILIEKQHSGISFSIVNPYFIDLRPAYQPSSRRDLFGKFLDTEISNVNNKLNSILENNKNLYIKK